MKSALAFLVLMFWFCGPVRTSGGTVLVLSSWDASVTNAPPGLTNIVALAAGLDDALALRGDGSVVAWGANDYGITTIPSNVSIRPT